MGADNLERLVDGFEHALVRQGRSQATIDTYHWALTDLMRSLFARGIDDISQLTLDRRELLEAWQNGHIQRGLKPRTRALLMVSAQQFLRYLSARGLVDGRLQWVLDRPRVGHSLPRPIPPEDLRRLVAYLLPRRPMMRPLELRDRALFFLLLATSARISEALQMRRDQLERPIVLQKGGGEKLLRVPAVVQLMVDDYLAARDDDSPWLWATHENHLQPHRLDVSGAREAWARICHKVGVVRFTNHAIRHTGASLLFDLGLDSLEVARHLGHSGLAHVGDYVDLSGRRDRAVNAMQRFIAGEP